jgi:hypothetical protein
VVGRQARQSRALRQRCLGMTVRYRCRTAPHCEHIHLPFRAPAHCRPARPKRTRYVVARPRGSTARAICVYARIYAFSRGTQVISVASTSLLPQDFRRPIFAAAKRLGSLPCRVPFAGSRSRGESARRFSGRRFSGRTRPVDATSSPAGHLYMAEREAISALSSARRCDKIPNNGPFCAKCKRFRTI